MEFDFEYWMQLQQTDPETFEIERQRIIDHYIENAGRINNRSLHGLQFKIDAVRSRSTNPLGACIRLNRMMLNHVLESRELPDETNHAACEKNNILQYKRIINEK